MKVKPLYLHSSGELATVPPRRGKHLAIPFGIYLKTRKTSYGHCDIGKYKGVNIEIYHDYESNSKLYYISDSVRKWIKSKLIYFFNGVKRIARSENTK